MDTTSYARTSLGAAIESARDHDDPGVNMTPMIDIVFQLLIFFMLTLRFRSVDRRIDSEMPRRVGMTSSAAPETPPRLVVKLFRKHGGSRDHAFTRIRIANRHTIDLPGERSPVWEGLEPARDEAIDQVVAALGDVWRRGGLDPAIEGEIRTPLPEGQAVPHADVVAVLDAFLRADFGEVRFAGSPVPMPGR